MMNFSDFILNICNESACFKITIACRIYFHEQIPQMCNIFLNDLESINASVTQFCISHNLAIQKPYYKLHSLNLLALTSRFTKLCRNRSTESDSRKWIVSTLELSYGATYNASQYLYTMPTTTDYHRYIIQLCMYVQVNGIIKLKVDNRIHDILLQNFCIKCIQVYCGSGIVSVKAYQLAK